MAMRVCSLIAVICSDCNRTYPIGDPVPITFTSMLKALRHMAAANFLNADQQYICPDCKATLAHDQRGDTPCP